MALFNSEDSEYGTALPLSDPQLLATQPNLESANASARALEVADRRHCRFGIKGLKASTF